MDVPVLLIAFNRPEHTKRLIEKLVSVGARDVYVAVDGPRDGNESDQRECSEVRKLIDSARWPGTVVKNYHQTNLGCRKGVSEAITWFFNNVTEGIILEDDCLPDDTFFEYCRELLERFRENPRIGMIAGSNFFPAGKDAPYSYTFSHYPHIWGWATWRRAWANYDTELEGWREPESMKTLTRVSGGSHHFERFWTELLDAVSSGRIDTWDYIWSYSFWRANFLSVVPGVNMITNIGFDEQATHTRSRPIGRNFRPRSLPLDLPLLHPESVLADHLLEQLTRELAMGVRGKHIRTLLRLIWLTPVKRLFGSGHSSGLKPT